MAGTVIKECTCPNEYQDKRYGKGKRVHNNSSAKGVTGRARCATCGNVKDSSFKVKK